MTRVLLPVILMGWMVPAITWQERAPSGQIYGELLPFVGLEGVRLEVV